MAIFNNNGTIALSFEYKSKRFVLSGLGSYSDTKQLQQVKQTELRIKTDRKANNFPFTDNESVKLFYFPSSEDRQQMIARTIATERRIEKERSDLRPQLIADLQTRLAKRYSASEYSLLNKLEGYRAKITDTKDAQAFITSLNNAGKTSNNTVKRYLNCLKAISDVFQDISVDTVEAIKEKPFTREEVALILNWFKSSKYYNHYHDYVMCLFLTGMRTNEVTGLQWKHIDWNTDTLIICSALAKSGTGNEKIRKTTKTGKIRYFPMSNGLLAMMKARYETSNKHPESLVFPSPTGKPIDDHNFTQRIWHKALESLNIEYRTQYNTRHTFISHFLDQTKDFAKCAMLTHGHMNAVGTLMKHYANLVNRIEVPEMF